MDSSDHLNYWSIPPISIAKLAITKFVDEVRSVSSIVQRSPVSFRTSRIYSVYLAAIIDFDLFDFQGP